MTVNNHNRRLLVDLLKDRYRSDLLQLDSWQRINAASKLDPDAEMGKKYHCMAPNEVSGPGVIDTSS
jgi:hypothetical protein